MYTYCSWGDIAEPANIQEVSSKSSLYIALNTHRTRAKLLMSENDMINYSKINGDMSTDSTTSSVSIGSN